MNASKLFLVGVLLIASLALLSPNVQAQTTKIVEVRNPMHVLAGGDVPFAIQAVVSFQDARPNSSLVVGVLDIDSKPQKVVPGIVSTASPDLCTNPPALLAFCVIKLHSSSGTENLEFKVGGLLGGQPRRLGTWNLNLTAAILDSNSALIAKSASSVPFGVDLSPLSLTVDVPTQVKATVDGTERSPGSVTVGVVAGSHNISVPLIAYVDSGKRLRFDRWSDGFTEPNRTVNVRSASHLEAVYAIQYRLTLTGEQGTATGQGWYDAGSTATFSVPRVEPLSGFLGSLGGKMTFQSWNENGRSLTNSPFGSIVMNQTHTLTVGWQPDYLMPITIIAIPIIVIALILGLVIRKRAGSGKAGNEIRAPSSPRARPRPPSGAASRAIRSRRSKSSIRRRRRQ